MDFQRKKLVRNTLLVHPLPILVSLVFVTALIIFLLTQLSLSTSPTPQATQGSNNAMNSKVAARIPFAGSKWFLVGYNYPWRSYKDDFSETPSNIHGQRATIEKHFTDLASHGTHVVRWFMFNDLSQSPLFDDQGFVKGLSPSVFQSLDTMVAIAHANHIYLILDFIDGTQALTKGKSNTLMHSKIFTDSAVRQSFFENAVKPILRRYGNDPSILAWSPVNEPDYDTIGVDADQRNIGIAYSDMRAFMQQFTHYVHTYTRQMATIENGPLHFTHFWTELNFDFYSPHYYDWMSSSWPDSNPVYMKAANFRLDKPIVLGELPSANSKYSVTELLNALYKNGYAGALFWSYNVHDPVSDFAGTKTNVKQWAAAHEAEVNIH